MIPESLLHTIWKYKLHGVSNFVGTQGEKIEVISTGLHNYDSGPDFFNAKIKVNDILLAGNVEIHVYTSDWLKHRHQFDKLYDNLVLHVVYEHDIELNQNNQFNVPVLQLKSYINEKIVDQYRELNQSRQTIACGNLLPQVNDVIWSSWIDSLTISRIERKTEYIESVFRYCNNSYEDVLYVCLLRNFGFKVNNEPFELLAKKLPYSILKKHNDNFIQVEALLFGVAGFLDELFEDNYPKSLQNEFEFLKQKYQLQIIKKESWKFSKTRPVNFPTIRISQLASLITSQQSLFHLLEQKVSIDVLRDFFNIGTSKYWLNHFMFNQETVEIEKKLGDVAFNGLVINTIVPFLFFIAKHSTNESYIDYALDLLCKLPAEINTKTKAYTQLGVVAKNASESQAQIELYDYYCTEKKCLDCRIGENLLKNQI